MKLFLLLSLSTNVFAQTSYKNPPCELALTGSPAESLPHIEQLAVELGDTSAASAALKFDAARHARKFFLLDDVYVNQSDLDLLDARIAVAELNFAYRDREKNPAIAPLIAAFTKGLHQLSDPTITPIRPLIEEAVARSQQKGRLYRFLIEENTYIKAKGWTVTDAYGPPKYSKANKFSSNDFTSSAELIRKMMHIPASKRLNALINFLKEIESITFDELINILEAIPANDRTHGAAYLREKCFDKKSNDFQYPDDISKRIDEKLLQLVPNFVSLKELRSRARDRAIVKATGFAVALAIGSQTNTYKNHVQQFDPQISEHALSNGTQLVALSESIGEIDSHYERVNELDAILTDEEIKKLSVDQLIFVLVNTKASGVVRFFRTWYSPRKSEFEDAYYDRFLIKYAQTWPNLSDDDLKKLAANARSNETSDLLLTRKANLEAHYQRFWPDYYDKHRRNELWR